MSGEADDDVDNTNKSKGFAETLEAYCELLSIDPIQVDIFSRCNSITKTCRSIVSCLVPKEKRIGSSWKEISIEKRNAVLGNIKKCYSIFDYILCIDMARLLNPAEKGKTDGELIKACRNVFDIANSSNRKQEQTHNENEGNSIDDDENQF